MERCLTEPTSAAPQPLVTIVVPAYNAAATVKETLESLAAQTYEALEVIVVDDGSSDKTAEIAQVVCQQFPERLRYVHQANAGQASALNAGWKQAKGAFLGYLSADDVLYPKALERLVQELQAQPGLCGVYPDYHLIDAKSVLIREVKSPEFSSRDLVERSICQPGPGALFRADAYAKTGGWNRELRLTPDFDFWLRLCLQGDLARVPELLAGFRVHEDSQSFAVPNENKSEEPVRVISMYFAAVGKTTKWNGSNAMAWAHTLSARLHLRAGRWSMAYAHLLQGLLNQYKICFFPRFWHLLGSGLFGRLRYQLQSSTNP